MNLQVQFQMFQYSGLQFDQEVNALKKITSEIKKPKELNALIKNYLNSLK